MLLENIKKFSKNKDLIFSLIVFLVIIGISILMPTYQIPDEPTHLKNVYKSLGNDIDLGEYINDENSNFGKMMLDDDVKVDKDTYFTNSIMLPKVHLSFPRLTILKYFPQAIGILIASLFSTSLVNGLFIVEVLAALFYAISCYITLKMFPLNKRIFRISMFIPMLLQQMGSLSYDVTVISLSFIFISYMFKIKYDKEKFDLKRLLIALGLICVIGYIKLPFILLGLLILLIPIDKYKINIFNFEINKKFILSHKLLLIISFILLVVLAFVFGIGNSNIRFLLVLLTHPIETIKMIVLTTATHIFSYIGELCSGFGWLTIKSSIVFVGFFYIFLLLFSLNKEEQNKLSKKDIIKIIILLFLYYIGILLSLSLWGISVHYGYSDIASLGYSDMSSILTSNNFTVLGVQGRYFIPIAPLILLVLNNLEIKRYKIKKIYIFEIIYYAVIIGYMAYLLLNRYWI